METGMKSQSAQPLITVCVCTFRRPELLAELLDSLAAQTYPAQRIEVIVVDNDHSESARKTVDAFAQKYSNFNVRYDVERIQGISFARNRTVSMASGEVLAFIDDDERASPQWLDCLLRTLQEGQFSAVFGPVISVYPPGTPRWIERSGLFDRPRHITGARIGTDHGRTGNAMVFKQLALARGPNVFDPSFAHSGGEDHDFFKWLESTGGTLGWNDEAIVEELVPLARQRLTFILERALRTSATYWHARYSIAAWPYGLGEAGKGLFGAAVFGLLGVLALGVGLHQSAKCWMLGAKSLGRVFALMPIRWKGY